MAGMFGNLFGPDPEAEARDRRQRALALMTPDQQLRYTANSSAAGIGEGISQAFGGGDKRAQASQELKALAQSVRPGTPEFYEKAAAILQKYGLVEEAAAMQERLNSMKQQDIENERAGQSDVGKWQKTLDKLYERKKNGDNSVDAAIAAIEQKLKTYGVEKARGSGAQSGLGKLIADMNAETDPKVKAMYGEKIAKELKRGGEGGMSAANRIQLMRLEAQIERWKAEDARKNAEEKRKQEAADTKAADAKQGRAEALKNYYIELGRQVRDTEELRDHPGLNGIVGPVYGRTPTITDDSSNALAVYKRVQGQTFLRALKRLKEASKSGASGLGQLTEIEGEKIQNAEVALDRVQNLDSMVTHIDTYLLELRSAMQAAQREMQALGVSPPPIPALPKGYKPQQNPKQEPVMDTESMSAAPPPPAKPKVFDVGPDGKVKRSK